MACDEDVTTGRTRREKKWNKIGRTLEAFGQSG